MKKKLLQFSTPAGLIIYLGYKVASRYVVIQEALADILCVVSVVLMLIGTAYHGWCFGKRKSPYSK